MRVKILNSKILECQTFRISKLTTVRKKLINLLIFQIVKFKKFLNLFNFENLYNYENSKNFEFSRLFIIYVF